MCSRIFMDLCNLLAKHHTGQKGHAAGRQGQEGSIGLVAYFVNKIRPNAFALKQANQPVCAFPALSIASLH